MHSHTLDILGFELSFRAKADSVRVEKAKYLLEERYAELAQHGGLVSKEKLLVFLALSLADDVLLMQQERKEGQEHMRRLLDNIEKATE